MYIFDLDGTLAETRENRKLPPEKVIERTKLIYLDLNHTKDCIVVSGRDEKQRLSIYEFLGLQGLFPRLILNDLPFPKLPNHEYKRIVFQRLIDEGSTIDGVFDDNPAVGDACRDLGIPFYLVKP